ncbi:MAG: alkene reductase [Pseudomonadota bacterium]
MKADGRRDLFLPARLGPLRLANRIVMAPLTRSRADAKGCVKDITALYYSQRASAGLIVSEATAVSPQAHGYAWTPGLHSAAHGAAWGRVTRAVQRNGGRIFAQLWHGGRIGHPVMQPGGARPVAPSAIRPAGKAFTPHGLLDMVAPRALESEEVPGIVSDFRRAARQAIAAGFDGVELHGANGYLIDQFLRDKTNKRADRYGGSIANRCRFALEVVEAVAGEIGASRVGLRISPLNPFNDIADSDPRALFCHLAAALNEVGPAYLHVVERVPHLAIDPATAFDLDELRRLFKGAYMVNGGYDGRKAEVSIDTGRADFVAFGRAYIANPDLVARLAGDHPIAEPDRETYYGGGEKGYTDYPRLAEAG